MIITLNRSQKGEDITKVSESMGVLLEKMGFSVVIIDINEPRPSAPVSELVRISYNQKMNIELNDLIDVYSAEVDVVLVEMDETNQEMRYKSLSN